MKSKKDVANVTAHIACVYAHELIINPSSIVKKISGYAIFFFTTGSAEKI